MAAKCTKSDAMTVGNFVKLGWRTCSPFCGRRGEIEIFRLTAKMAGKIGVALTEALPPDENPFADWTAHLFTVRRTQYVILMNTAALYAVILPGRGMADEDRFLRLSLDGIRDYMRADGCEPLFERFIAPSTGPTSFAKTGDRRVLGSLNDLVRLATFDLEDGLPTFEASRQVNMAPMSFLKGDNPRRALVKMAGDYGGK